MRCDVMRCRRTSFLSARFQTKRRKKNPRTDDRQTNLLQAATATATVAGSGSGSCSPAEQTHAPTCSALLRARGIHGATGLLGWRQSRALPLIASSRTRQDKLERISRSGHDKAKDERKEVIYLHKSHRPDTTAFWWAPIFCPSR